MYPDSRSGINNSSFHPGALTDARSFCTRMPDYDPVLGRLGRKLKGHKMSFERGMRRFEIKQYRAEERRRDHFLSKSMNCLPESGQEMFQQSQEVYSELEKTKKEREDQLFEEGCNK